MVVVGSNIIVFVMLLSTTFIFSEIVAIFFYAKRNNSSMKCAIAFNNIRCVYDNTNTTWQRLGGIAVRCWTYKWDGTVGSLTIKQLLLGWVTVARQTNLLSSRFLLSFPLPFLTDVARNVTLGSHLFIPLLPFPLEPQLKSNFVHFSFKRWDLAATILIISSTIN